MRPLSQYTQELNENGFVVVENAIDPKHLSAINEQFLAAWEKFRAAGKRWKGAGSLVGHYQSSPPTFGHCLFEDVLANETFYKITRAALKDEVIATAYTCNTNVPGSTRQSFHMDDAIEASDYLIINIPLVDVDETNGSTEIIPGTHKLPFSFSHLKEVIKTSKPIRINMKRGSAFIRYASTWHRGTANYSSSPRFMLSFTHHAMSSPRLSRIHGVSLPSLAESFFNESGMKIKANFSGNGNSAQFFPHYYFGQHLKGIIKEFCFFLSPTLCEKAKHFAELVRAAFRATT